MLVKSITEEEIYGIGHAFGYYDYGEETGMSAAFSGKEATVNYICAYGHRRKMFFTQRMELISLQRYPFVQ